MHGGFVFDTPYAEQIKNGIYEIVFAFRNEQTLSEVRLSQKLYTPAHRHGWTRPSQEGGADGGKRHGLQAMHFIQEQYMNPISLLDVATHVNMSQFHFSRLFKKDCGLFAP